MDLTGKFLIFVLALSTAACSHGRFSRHWSPDYKIHRDVLENGLTVLYVEDHSVPVVSYTSWIKVGSAWESKGATGIAHLFEHMMFKGTPRYSGKQFFRTLEGKGATLNAFTQRDATVFYEVIASQYLELVMDMESDRLANLVFTQGDLDSERQVVKEERRLRVESSFEALQMEALQKLAFPTHPYGWPVIGYQDDLDKLSLAQCRHFFETYYQPGNVVITIAGDFDFEQARGWMRKYYGAIRGHAVPELAIENAKAQGKELIETVRKPVEAESLLIGYFIPSMYDADANKLSMLSWSLFGMSSSRANLKLVREKQIALSVSADASLERFPYLFLISVDMKSGVPASRALEEIDALVDEVQRAQIPEEELARVKNRLIYSTVNEGKSPAGVASWLASGEFYWGDSGHIFKTLDAYHTMKPRDLQEVAKKYLRPENRVIVVLKPEKNSGVHL